MHEAQIFYAAWRDSEHMTHVHTYCPGIPTIGRQYERDMMATATAPFVTRAPTSYEQHSLALPAKAVVMVARTPIVSAHTLSHWPKNTSGRRG